MPDLTWTALNPALTLPAKEIVAPWIVVSETIPSTASYIKILSEGTWVALLGLKECGPDGLVGHAAPSSQILVEDCALGALIGRFGGSSASLKGAGADAAAALEKPFAVGSHAVVKVPDTFVGPLFLGFNVLRRPLKLQSLKVEIFIGA